MRGGAERASASRQLTALHPGLDGLWIPDAAFAALRRHPALPEAVARAAGSLADLYEGHRLLNHLLCDRGRVLLGLFILYLDVLPSPETGEVGATLGSIQAMCRRTGLCSRGRAASIVAAMRFGGYVVARPDSFDGRKIRLAPTDRLLEQNRRHWRVQFESMRPILPRAARVLPVIDERGFTTAFLRALGGEFLAGFRVLAHVPVLARLAESNAGLFILSSLALGALRTPDLPALVPFSVSAMARRFCVARAHVRNMLAISEHAGLLICRPECNAVLVLPALTEAILQFFAVLFAMFDRCAACALVEISPAPGDSASILARGGSRVGDTG